MTLPPSSAAPALSAISSWLPRGRTLPEEIWQVRHRAVTALLILHAAVFAVAGVATGRSIDQALVDAAVPALGAFAASRSSLPRAARSGIAAVSLMLTSAVVVQLMDGRIEGHFHFFVMIPVVALYEDWLPFGLAVSIVLIHHGVMGTLAPDAVYNHSGAQNNPWAWAVVHASFFAAACVGAVINWRLNEQARQAQGQLTEQVRYQADHDPLTGLPNRGQLVAHGQGVFADAKTSGATVAVLLVDLDHFKEVNDVLGHAAGDVLLSRLGPLMSTAVRSGDLLCRLGGDEFAAVLRDTDEQRAVSVAHRLIELISMTMDIEGVLLNIEASIGIAISTAGDGNVEDLLRQADIAMYTAKRGKSGCTVYDVTQETSTRERLNLIGEMWKALENEEFVLHYQPKVALSDGRLTGVEALARWEHPTRGLLRPVDFIPVAECTGLIVPFTLYALRRALSQLRDWQADAEECTVAVNLSPRCLADAGLTVKILALLREFDVPPHLLELEITENTLAHDPDRALATLTELHNAGIAISIDDFGTGYSSMSYLKRLPVSELKVDRSFVSGMLTDAGDDVLVRSVIDLGHNLGLTVVAEGVEDQATMDALAAAGCDVAQGYHLGRPMTLEALRSWRRDRELRAISA